MLTRALGALCVWPLLAMAARPLTHEDYAGWKSIQTVTLSRDGKWLAYALFPQEGDGQLVIREIATGKEHREPVGAQPPAAETNPDGEGPPARRPSIRIAFTGDSAFVAASTFPPAADKSVPRAKNGLVIVGLTGFTSARVPGVKSFQVPEHAGRWMAYLLEAPSKAKADLGTELRVRNLETGEETKVPSVTEFSLAKDADLLVYAVSAATPASNGVFMITPGNNTPRALLSGEGKYSKLTWDRAQRQLVFLADQEKRTSLYHWPRQAGAGPTVMVRPDAAQIAAKGALSFSRNGESVWFGTLPPAAPKAATAAPGVAVDLWHWKDPLIQPMQKVRAARERDRSYQAVVHLKDRAIVQIGSPALPTVTPSDDGLWAIGADERPYSTEVDHDAAYADYYLVDARTGDRRLIAEKLRANSAPAWSASSRHALFYRDRDWYVSSVNAPATYNLTRGLDAAFHNEEWDTPSAPAAYGQAGFTADGRGVLLYDRYDVWLAAPDASKITRLTAGREKQFQFRVLRLDSDDDTPARGVDLTKPLYLTATDESTRGTGIYRLAPGGGAAPEKLAWEDKRALQFVTKAKNAGTVVMTASSFSQFPDLEVTDTSFGERKKATDANPQARDIAWGSAELISYRSADGEPLRGTLIKPAGFDATKKYPLLVYIYERLSQGLHTYPVPQPGSSSINQAYYASNGYLLLLPDISYRTGMPGQSAIKCVLPAIDAVVSKGFVNERAIGIQGHSWGGYQIAYMVTQTNRFRAAAAGAPVGNMTSAYNGIRWGTGLPRQFQYEHTQSRIGGTLWTAPLKFLENSPVFMADRVETPVLMMHNDADDAVPWQQGIEMFLSLRRNGKEAYMFNYNGEKHGLRKRANQMDWARRMQEFFDHYLKDAARPAWMERGIPFLERNDAAPKPPNGSAPAPSAPTPTEGQ